MEYNHSHNHDLNLGNAFKIGIPINIIFIVVEALFGYFSNSMALIADALMSLCIVVAGVIMAFTGIAWVDSLVPFAIIGVTLYSSYHLLIDSVNLALDAVPENINMEAIREYLKTLPEVEGIHDLHIWALSTTDAALTVHLTTRT